MGDTAYARDEALAAARRDESGRLIDSVEGCYPGELSPNLSPAAPAAEPLAREIRGMLLIDDEDICGATMKAIREANHKRHLDAPDLIVGDLVVPIRPDGNWLVPGETYTVIGAMKSSVAGNLVELDRPKSILWGAWRFRKVEE